MNYELGMNLSIREIEEKDFILIADYWLKSDSDFLVNMGVDLKKLPTREGLISMLQGQLALPIKKKMSFALIWEQDGEAIGHCNVNEIEFGVTAKMHLHLWNNSNKQKGIGLELLKKSIPVFFDKLELKTLVSEPYALNLAPNKTLEKAGFTLEKRYVTTPGSLNFEQEVCRWVKRKTQ